MKPGSASSMQQQPHFFIIRDLSSALPLYVPSRAGFCSSSCGLSEKSSSRPFRRFRGGSPVTGSSGGLFNSEEDPSPYTHDQFLFIIQKTHRVLQDKINSIDLLHLALYGPSSRSKSPFTPELRFQLIRLNAPFVHRIHMPPNSRKTVKSRIN